MDMEGTQPEKQALLSLDVSEDGYTVAAGTELSGEEASIVFWYVHVTDTYYLTPHPFPSPKGYTRSLQFHP